VAPATGGLSGAAASCPATFFVVEATYPG